LDAASEAIGALEREFARHFGAPPTTGARAPGRVNLIGEHTDYSEGLVLPCAIDRDTVALARPRDDRRIRVFAADLDEQARFDADSPRRAGDWSDYARGVVVALGEHGVEVRGLDIAVASRVPRESGLSSSAALELAIATAIDRVQRLGLSTRTLAHIAHRAESGTVGVECGIMDQLASALGRAGHALRIDCRSEEVRAVPLPRPALSILISHSGVRRKLAAGGYADRVAECRLAFEGAHGAGIGPAAGRSLRDLSMEDLPRLEEVLPQRLLRRARHVLCENARVERMCEALRRVDLDAVGEILADGQRSLARDFEVSIPELEALCEIGDGIDGVVGSRQTGAGFGGCTIHLVRADAARDASALLASGFERRFGRRPTIHQVEVADGASGLDEVPGA